MRQKPLLATQRIIIPATGFLKSGIYSELYEQEFLKDLFEMAFVVFNKTNNVYLRREGITYTVSSAIMDSIDELRSELGLETGDDYLSPQDIEIMFDIVDTGYHYINHLFDLYDLHIREEIELTPLQWVSDNVIVKTVFL